MSLIPPPRQRRSVPLRIMTYNVHYCRGVDRTLSPERIAQVIASCHPDIVALQELDVGRARSGMVDQAMSIARDLGMDVQFFPSLRIMEESYGNAILSRWPARLVKAEPLPGLPRLPRLEPRGAIWATVTVEGIDVQIVNTHLGLFRLERLRQVEALLGADWLAHPLCREPVILLGDFNARPRSRAYRRLAARLQDVQRGVPGARPKATFPTWYPTFRLDHIFVDERIEIVSASPVRTPLARLASDHLPLVAELNIPVPSGRAAVPVRELSEAGS